MSCTLCIMHRMFCGAAGLVTLCRMEDAVFCARVQVSAAYWRATVGVVEQRDGLRVSSRMAKSVSQRSQRLDG